VFLDLRVSPHLTLTLNDPKSVISILYFLHLRFSSLHSHSTPNHTEERHFQPINFRNEWFLVILVPVEISILAECYCFTVARILKADFQCLQKLVFYAQVILQKWHDFCPNWDTAHFVFISELINCPLQYHVAPYIQHSYVIEGLEFDLCPCFLKWGILGFSPKHKLKYGIKWAVSIFWARVVLEKAS
jgi:hypothetical protein